MSEAPSRWRILLAFAAVYVVWGSTYLAIRFAIETIPPLLMAGSRFFIAGALLYAWSRANGEPRPSRAELRHAAIAGVLLLCLGNGGVAWSEQRVPSGLAALIVAVVPLWIVVLDWLRPGGSRPAWLVLVGVAVGLAGLVILVGPETLHGRGAVDPTGVAVLIFAALCWAAGSVYNRYAPARDSALMSTALQMLGGSTALIVGSLVFGEPRAFDVRHVSGASWLGLAYLVTFGSLIGFTAYVYLLKTVSPAKASTYAYVNPLVAVLLGWAIAGEAVTPGTIISAGVILTGVALITVSQTRGRFEATSSR